MVYEQIEKLESLPSKKEIVLRGWSTQQRLSGWSLRTRESQ